MPTTAMQLKNYAQEKRRRICVTKTKFYILKVDGKVDGIEKSIDPLTYKKQFMSQKYKIN